MPDNANPKQQVLVASIDIQQDANNYIQKINKITQPFPEILVICFFQITLGMSDHT